MMSNHKHYTRKLQQTNWKKNKSLTRARLTYRSFLYIRIINRMNYYILHFSLISYENQYKHIVTESSYFKCEVNPTNIFRFSQIDQYVK